MASGDGGSATALTRWLSRSGARTQSAFAIATAFATYFCMYAFRKPFAAAEFSGAVTFGDTTQLTYKTLFVVAQILGYALSKFVGIKVCSEAGRVSRFPLLVSLIVGAELALVAFGAIPASMPWLKAAAIFANGLPLGMVWGLVVLYLEGRRLSEVMLTGLSCSYIVASGVVKDIGRALLAGSEIPLPFATGATGWVVPNPLPPVGEFWMPAVTGALFLAPFALAAWLLDQLPEPDQTDRDERVRRQPMKRDDRRAFVRQYATAIVLALAAYFVLTAYRDYRDNYMVDVFGQLGYDYAANKAIVSQSELLVAVGVMAILSQLYRLRDNRLGLIVTYGVMSAGLAAIGLATLLLDARAISGFWWMTIIGFGAYLAYVPFGSVLFDRSIAQTRFVGTAVFGIYLADAVGYTGSVALQLSKDLGTTGMSHLDFLRALSYVLSVGGSLALAGSCVAFLRRTG